MSASWMTKEQLLRDERDEAIRLLRLMVEKSEPAPGWKWGTTLDGARNQAQKFLARVAASLSEEQR